MPNTLRYNENEMVVSYQEEIEINLLQRDHITNNQKPTLHGINWNFSKKNFLGQDTSC